MGCPGAGQIGRPAVPALCSALNEGNESAAWQAAAALGLIGDANASRPLREALQSGSSNVRYWAAALGGLDDNSSKESLIFALGDENASVRYEAGLALRATEGAGAADIFIGLLQDENGSRRAGAACARGMRTGAGRFLHLCPPCRMSRPGCVLRRPGRWAGWGMEALPSR